MSISRVFVAGAGLMGHGIAQVFAAIERDVALYEPTLERARAGRERVAGNLERVVAKGHLT
ncbi:MAG TPA: 3-hydroxyacyl-CoA dehydrogenase NAD-binding domain-containing protein, partial [Candidatus Limnocylindrales bacterium]|nr:3-hydroxyacyl-CoA dehydrogenase NAD-binding domain-containing protein [Candidatus Limnocylindrales bacterium]